MAYPKTNTAEGGTAAATVTTGNSGSGSGTAFDFVSIDGAGATLIWDNARGASGTQSIKMTNAATPGAVTRMGWQDSSQTTLYGRVYLYRTAMPAGSGLGLLQFQTVGVSVNGVIRLNTSGVIICEDSAASAVGGTVAITLNAWNRIEFRIVSSDTVGVVEAKLFSAHSTTVLDTITKSSGDTNPSCDGVFFGEMLVSDGGQSSWLDDLQVNATGYPGPSVTGLTKSGYGIIG